MPITDCDCCRPPLVQKHPPKPPRNPFIAGKKARPVHQHKLCGCCA